MIRAAVALVLVLVLASCASRAVREVPAAASGADIAAQDAREQQLGQAAGWSFTGRIAISNGNEGGSGRIEWQQLQDDGARRVSIITLSAPVTRQSWRLTMRDDGSATLEGLKDGTRRGPDAAALLREATGWDIPVSALAYWVRALRVPGAAVEAQRFDGQSRLLQLQQGGWMIDYQWAEPVAGQPPMPRRIDALRGQAKVKLVLDQWR